MLCIYRLLGEGGKRANEVKGWEWGVGSLGGTGGVVVQGSLGLLFGPFYRGG